MFYWAHCVVIVIIEGKVCESWLVSGVKGTGRSEEAEISRNITFSEKILTESRGIWEDVDEIFCQNSP